MAQKARSHSERRRPLGTRDGRGSVGDPYEDVARDQSHRDGAAWANRDAGPGVFHRIKRPGDHRELRGRFCNDNLARRDRAWAESVRLRRRASSMPEMATPHAEQLSSDKLSHRGIAAQVCASADGRTGALSAVCVLARDGHTQPEERKESRRRTGSEIGEAAGGPGEARADDEPVRAPPGTGRSPQEEAQEEIEEGAERVGYERLGGRRGFGEWPIGAGRVASTLRTEQENGGRDAPGAARVARVPHGLRVDGERDDGTWGVQTLRAGRHQDSSEADRHLEAQSRRARSADFGSVDRPPRAGNHLRAGRGSSVRFLSSPPPRRVVAESRRAVSETLSPDDRAQGTSGRRQVRRGGDVGFSRVLRTGAPLEFTLGEQRDLGSIGVEGWEASSDHGPVDGLWQHQDERMSGEAFDESDQPPPLPRRGRSYLKDFAFLDVGINSLTNLTKIGIENVRPYYSKFAKFFKNKRDLLPMSVEQACKFLGFPQLFTFVNTGATRQARSRLFRTLGSLSCGHRRRRKVKKLKRAAWVVFVLITLNSMFLGGFHDSPSNGILGFTHEEADWHECHERCLLRILQAVSNFEGAGTLESRGISAILDSIDLEESIYGLKRYAAEDIVSELAVPPLPAQCSTVDISSLCCESLDFLEKPECLLHDSFEHLTRRDLKPKQVWASDDEWNKFGRVALERGLFAEVSYEDIFAVNGIKVLSGAFAVPKVKGDQRLQRFILNLHNCIWSLSKIGELADPRLPYASAYTTVLVHDSEILVAGLEDESCSFFQYKLPPQWVKFLALSKPVVLPSGRTTHVGLTGVPMGWSASVSVLQLIQRYFARLAGLTESQEVRPDKLFPSFGRGLSSIYSLYVDNYAQLNKLKLPCHSIHEAAPGAVAQQKKFVAVKEGFGVKMNPKDSMVGQEVFDLLGAHFDGKTVGVDRRKRCLLIFLLYLILHTTEGISYSQAAGIVGIVSHCFLYKRCLFSLFERTYIWISNFRGGRFIPAEVRAELKAVCSLLIFAESDLRLKVDPYLRSSDASLWGGAFGVSTQPFIRDNYEAEDLLRRVDTRGTSIRLDGLDPIDARRGQLEAGAAGDRRPVIPLPAEWSVESSFPFGKQPFSKSHQHITELEAVTHTLQLRKIVGTEPAVLENSVTGIDTTEDNTSSLTTENDRRIFFGLDSLGAHGAMAKGRSSARRINRHCRRTAALSIAGGIYPVYYWIPSERMPMDSPSRRFQPGHVGSGRLDSRVRMSFDKPAASVSTSALADGNRSSEADPLLSLPPQCEGSESRGVHVGENVGVDGNGVVRKTHRGARGRSGGLRKRATRAVRRFEQESGDPPDEVGEHLPIFHEMSTFPEFSAEFSSARPSGLAETVGAEDCPHVGSSDCPQGSVSDDAPHDRLGFPVAQDDFSFLQNDGFPRSDRATCGSGPTRLAGSANFSQISRDLSGRPGGLLRPAALLGDLPRKDVENVYTAAKSGDDRELERASKAPSRPAGDLRAPPRLESADVNRRGRRADVAMRTLGEQRRGNAS